MKALYILLSILGILACEPARSGSTDGEGTIIVDVRTPQEWQYDGHAGCSVNYPLDQFSEKIPELKKYKKVILVCRSGNRAGHAKQLLEAAGYQGAENLGAWQNVQCSDTTKPRQQP